MIGLIYIILRGEVHDQQYQMLICNSRNMPHNFSIINSFSDFLSDCKVHDLLSEYCKNQIDWYTISCLTQKIYRAAYEQAFQYYIIFDKKEIGGHVEKT